MTFNADVRVLLCPQCGAPLEVAAMGGTIPCRFCGAQAQVAVRDDSLDQVLRPARQQLSEGERLSRLRAQASKPLVPPASIRHLFDQGAIPAWKLNEAITMWQSARQASQASGQLDAAEVVYFLAMALSSLFGEQKDTVRQRALLESSLEALRLPRHRQALRCMLARLACHSGEAASAEKWLAPCDPASDDLEMDTGYRFSLAVVATARGDFARVLEVLGRSSTEIPILEALNSTCVAFRANALERTGDVAGAAAALHEHMTNRPDHTALIEKTLAYWGIFQLCPASRGSAQAEVRQEKATAAAARTGGGVGGVFAVLGVLMAVVGAGLLIAGLLTGGHPGVHASPPPPHAKGAHVAPPPPPQPSASAGAHQAMTMAGGILLFMGLIFGGVGIPLQRSAAKARRIALTGTKARAQVKSATPTGMAINDVPQYAIVLSIQPADGAPPYDATVKVLGQQVIPGMAVGVLIDPTDPKSVILDR
jgi:hypothetical protein